MPKLAIKMYEKYPENVKKYIKRFKNVLKCLNFQRFF